MRRVRSLCKGRECSLSSISREPFLIWEGKPATLKRSSRRLRRKLSNVGRVLNDLCRHEGHTSKEVPMREIIASVTSKGQITIPVEMRRHLGVSTPDKVAIVKGKGRTIELRPVKYTVEELSGILPPLRRETEDFDDLIEEAMDDAVDQMLES